MPLSKQLFRESALERLSTPEQLDQLLQITSPKGWISLISIWALLAVVIGWTIFGKVHTKEDGRGIIVAGTGLKLAVTKGAGHVQSIEFNVGQWVAKDTIVAHIGKFDLEDELEETVNRRKELESQKEQLDALEDRARAFVVPNEYDRILTRAGAQGLLVGEALMAAPDPGAALAELLGCR